MMVVFGVIGYVFKKLKYPLAPLVLALVLGDMAETAFRQSMLLSEGTDRNLLSATAGRIDHDAGARAAAPGRWSRGSSRRCVRNLRLAPPSARTCS